MLINHVYKVNAGTKVHDININCLISPNFKALFPMQENNCPNFTLINLRVMNSSM